MFGDTVKLPTSTRIDVGDHFNHVQDGKPFFGGTSGGSGNGFTLQFDSGEYPSAKVTGQRFYFFADKANTGAVTVGIDTLSDDLKDITGLNDLPPGAIQAGNFVEIVYDGTVFRMLGARTAPDGWNLISKTGTYVSTTSFTIPGNFTSILTKGMKVKYSNTSAKYAYIKSVSFGGGATTVTLVPSDNYAVANTTLTDVFYSDSEMPLGFPTWLTWPLVVSPGGSMTWVLSAVGYMNYRISGTEIRMKGRFRGEFNGTASNELSIGLVVPGRQTANIEATQYGFFYYDEGSSIANLASISINSNAGTCNIRKQGHTNWSLTDAYIFGFNMSYEWE